MLETTPGINLLQITHRNATESFCLLKILHKMRKLLKIYTTRFIMKITEKNGETQMDALVKFTKENPQATESDILKKAEEIVEMQ